jgi:hypothetical protein
MSLWPFMPVGEVVEVLEWRTDVLRARASEQRFRLRERPRRQWHFKHLFTPEDQSAARAIVRGATSYQVPDWIRVIYAGPVSAGSSVSLAMTTAGYGLAAGQSVVLFNGISDYEICNIESVSPSALVLAFVATARAATGIYRVDQAHAAVALDVSRPAGPYQHASISFEAAAVEAYSASTYAQYRGHDVLPVVPVVGSGSLEEGVEWPLERFDNGSGLIATAAQRALPDDRFMMRWHVFKAADIQALRAWIASRYGRWLAFWQSTWERDLVAAADLGASATTLRVYAPAGVASLGRSAFDLEIQASGAVHYRRVTAVSAGPAVSGRPTFDLTIDSALGTDVAAAAFGRLSFLRCARFDADRIELLHRPGEGLAVSVPCIEVPVP